MDTNGNAGLPMPFPDALREFKVETSALPANFGNHSGGAVNGVTKSGTNEIHGDAFWFWRHYKFNATNSFGAPGPDGKRLTDGLKRNQFGGVLGGPIIKNKLFFFGGYQRTNQKISPTDTFSYGPTQAILNGDFTTLASTACRSTAITLKAPYVNNKIDKSLLDPIALKVLAMMPVSTDPCGKIYYGIPDDYNEDQIVGRVDWQQSDNHSLFFRYYTAKYYHPSAYATQDNILITTTEAGGTIYDNRIQTGLIGSTYVMNPTTILSTRLGITRSMVTRQPPDKMQTPTELGIKMYSGVDNYFHNSVTGAFTVGCGNCSPGYFAGTTPNFNFDASLMRGSHQLLMGFNWVNTALFSEGNFIRNARINFNGQVTNNGSIGMADYIIGKPSQLQQANQQDGSDRLDTPALYFQDNWKVSPRLSVNLGIRWDPYLPQRMTKGKTTHFEMAWFNQGKRSTAYTKAPVGMIFYGDPEMPGKSDSKKNMNQFSPRLGIVYDPKGDGQQTFRAGYGIFYETVFLWQMMYFSMNAPFGNQVTHAYPSSLADPWANYPGGNPFPTPNPIPKDYGFPAWGSYVNMPLDVKSPMTQQWNLSYQRQFGTNWMMGGTYMGNRTTHLWLGYQVTPGVYIPGNCVAGQYGLTKDGACSQQSNVNNRRKLYLQNPTEGQYYGSMSHLDDGGDANYNGLLLNIQKRMSRNISFMSNFTWSHCLSEGAMGQDISNRYQDPDDRHGNYGPCSTDRRKMFNSSFTLRTPKFGAPWMQAVAGNWQLSTIFTASTGTYGSISVGKNLSLTGINQDRANLVGDPVLSQDARSLSNWFNKAAFVDNETGKYGNSQPGIIEQPGRWNINLNLTRTFNIREGQKLDFRAEMFNALNHTNWGAANTTMNNVNYNKITSANGDPRIIQFALKYSF